MNLKAELEIQNLHEKIDHILINQGQRLLLDPEHPDRADGGAGPPEFMMVHTSGIVRSADLFRLNKPGVVTVKSES